MEVTFKRTGERRYAVIVERPGADTLIMHPAPGYDERMPHDLAHFVAERDEAIDHGIFGQLAAGGHAGTFHRADGVVDRQLKRRGDRLVRQHGADLARSEHAAQRLQLAVHAGRAAMELSERWSALAIGESMALAWPERVRSGLRSPRRG
jgi:hypothetical protein